MPKKVYCFALRLVQGTLIQVVAGSELRVHICEPDLLGLMMVV